MEPSSHRAPDRAPRSARRALRARVRGAFAIGPRGFTIRPRGFTIVEMLAVIGIIGILLSLLLPTVSSIRKEAQSVSCQANLRQLFNGVEVYRGLVKGQLPMCDFLPASTPEGPEGGLVGLLEKTLGRDCACWFCVADDDEEGSLEAGTSYLYVPGLLRYSPQVQIQVGALMAASMAEPLTERQRERRRVEAEARIVGALYQASPMEFAILTDSQDRHQYGTRNPRNAVYIDGSVGALRDAGEEDEEDDGEGGGGGGNP